MILLAVLLSALSSQARRLSVFFPEPDKANGAAVIVCPGGSYYWLSRKIEGTEVAKKLADAGFTAFVLHYRHAGTRYFLFGNMAIPQNHYPNALDDLREAVMEVRRKASEYSVDPSKVGVMGFSAGGHLVLNSGEEVIEDQGISSLPSFIVSVYPVIWSYETDFDDSFGCLAVSLVFAGAQTFSVLSRTGQGQRSRRDCLSRRQLLLAFQKD